VNTRYEPRLFVPLDAALSSAIATAVQAVGGKDFLEAILNVLGGVCGLDTGGAMLMFRDRRPRQLLHRFDSAARTVPDDAYVSGPYVLDPHYQRFLQGCESGAYWLAEIAPDDFYESEYYRVFYSQIGVSNSIDVLWRIDADSALVFFLERSVRSPAFDATAVAAVRLILPVVFAAIARHFELLGPPTDPAIQDIAHRKVQSTIEHFGSSLLTKREQEVLFFTLSGYSSIVTAERLNTTEGTVKIHRKNIYRKLDVGSQAELFWLFIQCIPFARPDDPADPLTFYQSTPAALRSLEVLIPT
jgi:DNA-binding CsgD family transcriptional regulator